MGNVDRRDFFADLVDFRASPLCLSQSFHIGLQIEIADKPVQVFGMNSQKACRLDWAAVGFAYLGGSVDGWTEPRSNLKKLDSQAPLSG